MLNIKDLLLLENTLRTKYRIPSQKSILFLVNGRYGFNGRLSC